MPHFLDQFEPQPPPLSGWLNAVVNDDWLWLDKEKRPAQVAMRYDRDGNRGRICIRMAWRDGDRWGFEKPEVWHTDANGCGFDNGRLFLPTKDYGGVRSTFGPPDDSPMDPLTYPSGPYEDYEPSGFTILSSGAGGAGGIGGIGNAVFNRAALERLTREAVNPRQPPPVLEPRNSVDLNDDRFEELEAGHEQA